MSPIDAVRKLVWVFEGVRRKVFRELGTNHRDGVDHSFGEVAFMKMRTHFAHQSIPELLPYPLMDTNIAQDDECTPARNDEEQHPVAMPSAVHSEPHERSLRRALHASPEERSNGDANLARCPFL